MNTKPKKEEKGDSQKWEVWKNQRVQFLLPKE
jgi:hypothetical protein